MMIKTIALACLAACVSATSPSIRVPIINEEIIAAVNNNPASSWTAGRSERFEGWSVEEFKGLLGARRTPSYLKPAPKKIEVGAIPASFNSSVQWPGCVGPILDQGHCGSCWAFGAVEALQDRMCIHGGVNVSLSEQDLVSCDKTNGGCDGGELLSAWGYLKKTGAVTSACYPYEMGTCQHPGCSEEPTPKCNQTCHDGSSWAQSKHFASSAYTISDNVADIQTEIMTNGPVEVAFTVYEDFATYKSGVYVHTSGQALGGHAVKNIGWGTDANGVDYWIIQNSWNPSWGMNGNFLIKRGVNECGIEDDVVAGMPKLK